MLRKMIVRSEQAAATDQACQILIKRFAFHPISLRSETVGRSDVPDAIGELDERAEQQRPYPHDTHERVLHIFLSLPTSRPCVCESPLGVRRDQGIKQCADAAGAAGLLSAREVGDDTDEELEVVVERAAASVAIRDVCQERLGGGVTWVLEVAQGMGEGYAVVGLCDSFMRHCGLETEEAGLRRPGSDLEARPCWLRRARVRGRNCVGVWAGGREHVHVGAADVQLWLSEWGDTWGYGDTRDRQPTLGCMFPHPSPAYHSPPRRRHDLAYL